MREEVCAAVKFLVCFIEKSEKVPRDQLSNFEKHLTDLLIERFEKHWFPNLPSKGQGYRCIRVNGLCPVDLTLETAATKCGIRYKDLKLPAELTVWVDPNEVCYRLGESEGSYCTLATFPQSDISSSSALSTSLSSSSNPSSTSSSPCPQSMPSSLRSHSSSPTPPHSPTLLHERQSITMGRRPGLQPPAPPAATVVGNPRATINGVQSVPKPASANLPYQNGNNGAAGYDYLAPLGKFRNNQGFQGGNCGGRQNRQSLRECPPQMNFNAFNPHHRQMYPRCDGPHYPMAPPFYRTMNYNRNYHKNVLRV